MPRLKSWIPDQVRDDRDWLSLRARPAIHWRSARLLVDQAWIPDRVRDDSPGKTARVLFQALDQARRIPAPAAHDLNIGIELVDQRRHRQARAVAFGLVQ